MTYRTSGFALLIAASLIAPAVLAEPQYANTRAGKAAEAQAQGSLRDAVSRSVTAEGLMESLRDYAISPSLVQLRRYVDADHHTKLVCVVDLAVQDRQGALVASIRGNATTMGMTRSETVYAAAHSAVVRIPGALQALESTRPDASAVAGR